MSSEQILKRRRNQGAILRYLHCHGPTRRMALSETTGIRKNSITDIVKELLNAGVLSEYPPGQMRSRIGIRPTGIVALTAAVCSSRISFSVVSADGNCIASSEQILADKGDPVSFIHGLLAGFSQLIRITDLRIAGIGVSFPGVVDSARGIAIKAVNLGIQHPWDIAGSLRPLGYPVRVENDVRAELWSYVWFGKPGETAENLLYIGLGEGLGAATITRGTLNIGQRLLAGEIGHIRAGRQGRLCSCGKQDCLECYCSARAIIQGLADIPGGGIHSADDLAGCDKNPEVAAVLEEAASCLSGVLAGVTAVIDPQAVVLGASHERLAQLLAPRLEAHLNRELAGLVSQGIPCLPGEELETAALKGVAGLVFKTAFSTLDFSEDTA